MKISGIRISSSEMVIHPGEDKQQVLPKFLKNQIIQAKILQLLPEGKVQLLVNGQKLTAKTHMPFNPGEEVQLKVISDKETLVLKLMAEPAQKLTMKQVSSLVRFFSGGREVTDVARSGIANVKDLLENMALKSGKPDADFLPRLIEKSGLVWEKKVAEVLLGTKGSRDIQSALDPLLKQDVKGSILNEILGRNPPEGGGLKSAAAFVESLETFQMLNHQSSDSGRFLLPFPIFNESAFRFGQMMIDLGEKEENAARKNERLVTVSFLLDMTRLGSVRADFSIFKKAVTGRFLLEDDDTRAYVESLMPELKEKMASIGYSVQSVECSLARKEEIETNCFVESMLRGREDQVLNIVI